MIPAKPGIDGYGDVYMTDVPTVFQIPGAQKWYLSFIGFDGKGYQSFIAESDDGIRWRRAKDEPILSIHQDDCGEWEKDCIYQPWLVEQGGRYYNFYNAANGQIEQLGLALITSKPLAGAPDRP